MKIHFTEIEHKTVNISDDEVLRICLEKLLDRFNLHNCHINGAGDLIHTVEHGGGSHSWYEDTVLRKATVEDKSVLWILQELPNG